MSLIFLIILIIFILLFNKLTETFSEQDQIQPPDGESPYRLGDLILYPAWNLPGEYNSSMLKNFPNSIGVMYLKEKFPCLKGEIGDSCIETIKSNHNDNYIDTRMLINIIKNDKNYPRFKRNFENNELVLHVRIGDALCKYNHLTNSFGTNKSHSQVYSKYQDKEWWDNVLNYIKNNNINTVYLMYGAHTNECKEESDKYIQDIKKSLSNYTVVDINKNTADQDLMFSVNAKHFITTGGGYGLIIGELVQKNGGSFVFKPARTVDEDMKNNIYFV